MPGNRDDASEARRVTYGEMQDFRTAIETGFTALRTEIKEARTEASQAHARMRDDWTRLFQTSIEHGGAINRLERDLETFEKARVAAVAAAQESAKQAIEQRRWLWAQVITVAALAGGAFAWVIDQAAKWRAHP